MRRTKDTEQSPQAERSHEVDLGLQHTRRIPYDVAYDLATPHQGLILFSIR